MKARVLVAALAAASVLAGSSAASAFCRTSSCGEQGTGTVCDPARPGDCGIPLFWPTDCVGITIQEDASSKAPLAEAEAIWKKAFDAWTTAACPGGGTPHIRVNYMGPVSCDEHEYNQDKALGNANIIIFRDDEWRHLGADSTLALTTVTYNKENGEIYDADIEVNSATVPITISDVDVKFDLQSIATHEAGHFLGLSHSEDMSATMTSQYMEGSVHLRDLEDDDKAAICAVYPPGDPIPETCDATPRHGFSELCADDPRDPVDTGCCSIAPGAPSGSTRSAFGAVAGLALLGLATAARRRKAAGEGGTRGRRGRE